MMVADASMSAREPLADGKQSAAAQRGGAIAFDWSEEGVVATLRMSQDRLAN